MPFMLLGVETKSYIIPHWISSSYLFASLESYSLSLAKPRFAQPLRLSLNLDLACLTEDPYTGLYFIYLPSLTFYSTHPPLGLNLSTYYNQCHLGTEPMALSSSNLMLLFESILLAPFPWPHVLSPKSLFHPSSCLLLSPMISDLGCPTTPITLDPYSSHHSLI